jgi:hypothetical protein
VWAVLGGLVWLVGLWGWLGVVCYWGGFCRGFVFVVCLWVLFVVG